MRGPWKAYLTIYLLTSILSAAAELAPEEDLLGDEGWAGSQVKLLGRPVLRDSLSASLRVPQMATGDLSQMKTVWAAQGG